jgi:drug/metabolite transporter (DMT)-like permease
MGTLMYATSYVITDAFFNGPSKLPPGLASTVMGLYATAILLGYQVVFVFPFSQKLIIEPIREHHSTHNQVLTGFVCYVASCLGHHWTYFRLMKNLGAVNTGILQSLRAVCVFAMSAWLFCDRDKAQCYNMYKEYSTIVVVICVLGFSWAGREKSTRRSQ